MTLEDLRWHFPDKLSKYPHLSSQDSFISNLYWKNNYLKFTSVSYDVPVGSGRAILENTPPELQYDWKYLTSLKIDMLGKTPLSLYICEFKLAGDLKAIGQLLSYQKLFIDKFAISNNIIPVCICNTSHPNILTAGQSLGIKFLLLNNNINIQLY